MEQSCPHCSTRLYPPIDAFCRECRSPLDEFHESPPQGESGPERENRYFRIVHAENRAELHPTDQWRLDHRVMAWIITAVCCSFAVITMAFASVHENSGGKAGTLWHLSYFSLALPALLWLC